MGTGEGDRTFDSRSPTLGEKTPRVNPKNDPRLVAAARELPHRWLELVNARLLPSQGKYDLSGALPDDPTMIVNLNALAILRALPAPIAA